jgi:hypothetical protein
MVPGGVMAIVLVAGVHGYYAMIISQSAKWHFMANNIQAYKNKE